jgi:hypothetical protein
VRERQPKIRCGSEIDQVLQQAVGNPPFTVVAFEGGGLQVQAHDLADARFLVAVDEAGCVTNLEVLASGKAAFRRGLRRVDDLDLGKRP